MTQAKQTNIRGLDTDLYRRLRIVALQQHLTMGELVNQAISNLLKTAAFKAYEEPD